MPQLDQQELAGSSQPVCDIAGDLTRTLSPVPTHSLLDGAQVEAMSDEDLAAAAERATLFARLAPAHKRRVVQALRRRRGHVVGFMGDGINDAPALRAADVGISVDSAVDVAKASADLILLEKSLLVLRQRAGFCAIAPALLASPSAHARQLRGADPVGEGLGSKTGVDPTELGIRHLPSP